MLFPYDIIGFYMILLGYNASYQTFILVNITTWKIITITCITTTVQIELDVSIVKKELISIFSLSSPAYVHEDNLLKVMIKQSNTLFVFVIYQ